MLMHVAVMAPVFVVMSPSFLNQCIFAGNAYVAILAPMSSSEGPLVLVIPQSCTGVQGGRGPGAGQRQGTVQSGVLAGQGTTCNGGAERPASRHRGQLRQGHQDGDGV